MSTTLALYGRILQTRWRWLMWGVLLTLAATVVVLIVQPPMYRSTATVFVRTPGDVSRVIDGGDSYAQARAETFAALATSSSVTSRVVTDLGLNLTPEALSQRIQATHEGGTALMHVEVSAPTAEEAQRTVTVLLNELSATVDSLESVPGSLVPRAELVVVDRPSQPVRLLAWGVPIWIVLPGVALLGLVLGAVGAVIRSFGEYPADDQADHATDPPPPVNATPDVLVGTDAATDTAPAGAIHGRHRAAQLPAEAKEEDA